MRLLVADAETAFDKDYTLRKMTSEHYVRDDRFEAMLLGVYEPETDTAYVIRRDDIQAWCDAQDWTQTAVLAHHAHFDGLILSHHYGVTPARWFDTLSMARLLHPNEKVSLAALSERYGLGSKLINYTDSGHRGKSWDALSYEERDRLGYGCLTDCMLTYALFEKLLPGFPAEELDVIDATVRLFVEPTLVGNREALLALAQDERNEKFRLLNELNVTEKDLQSAASFVALLEEEGVEVEYKQGKAGRIPAVAATDQFMRDLVEAQDTRVATLARARLEVRSTIDETRAGRLAGMASRGTMPVYLNYCGAQTLRWSGGDKVNFQNFRRGSALRSALSAPEGYLLAIIDLSQVEARLLAYLAGQDDLVEKFRTGVDPYLGLAARFYGEDIDPLDEARRGLGKLGVLSCGYGSGAATIQKTAKRGTYGPPVHLTDAEALQFRDTYRVENQAIVRFWGHCGDVLTEMSYITPSRTPWLAEMVVGCGYIEMPNGARMLYELERDHFKEGKSDWYRRTRSGWRKIWGGVLAQNICEAFGRLIISQHIVRMAKLGYKLVLTTHDEVVWLVKDDPIHSQTDLEWLVEDITTVPPYLEGLPLAAKASLSKEYSK